MDTHEISFPADIFGQAHNNLHPVAQFQQEIMAVEGAPPEFVVPFLLGSLSTAGARGLEVESFKDKHSRPNLYIVIEAESGTGKSEIGKRVFGPHFDYDYESRQRFDSNDFPSLVTSLRIVEAKLKKAERGERLSESEITNLVKEKLQIEKKMHGPRYVVEDCTQEALEQIISQQNGVLSLISSDARNVAKNLLGRHRKGSTEEDIFLKGWSGDSFSVDRISRGSIPPVREPCLSMTLALQPDLFRALVKPELVGSGFFPRILPARSCEGFSSHCLPRRYDPGIVTRYSDHIRSTFSFYRSAARPFQFPMSAEARNVMNQFHGEASQLAVQDPSLASCYRRWAEQACRIAVCIQLGFWGQKAHTYQLDVYCAQKAVALMRWFGGQQQELLHDISEEKKKTLSDRLLDLVQSHPEGISVRDAYKKLYTTKGVVNSLVDELPQLERISVQTGGRPSDVIRMKPATPGSECSIGDFCTFGVLYN